MWDIKYIGSKQNEYWKCNYMIQSVPALVEGMVRYLVQFLSPVPRVCQYYSSYRESSRVLSLLLYATSDNQSSCAFEPPAPPDTAGSEHHDGA